VGSGLTLAASPTEQVVLPGAHAIFALNVSNSLLLARSVTLSYNLSAGWVGSVTPQNLTIPAGGSANATLDLQAPADAPANATYSFPVTASDATGTLASTTVNVTIQAPPPPTPPTPVAPPNLRIQIGHDTGDAGSTVEGQLSLVNGDPGSPPLDVDLAIGGLASWHPSFPVSSFARLYAGSPQTVPVAVTIPAEAQNGTQAFAITATATVQGRSYQFVVVWNVTAVAAPPAAQPSSSGPTPVTPAPTTEAPSSPAAPQPNLALSLSDAQDLTPGYSSQETVLVQNTGNVRLHVHLAGSAADGSWRTTLVPNEMDLDAGASRAVVLTIDTPASAASGRDGAAKATVTATTDDGLQRYLPLDLRIPATSPASQAQATVAPPTPPGADAAPRVSGAAVALAAGLGAVGAGALVLAHRPWREKLLWVGIGLYTRLARPDVLGHEERERLYQIIEAQPGVHFHALQRELGWNTGTLTYHLRVLEKHGFVVDRRDGLYRRFYLQGTAPRKEVFETAGPQGLRADVLEAVKGRQGLSQTDLALALGANKQTVNYHVKALERQGLIRLEKRGRETFLYPADASASPGREAHA